MSSPAPYVSSDLEVRYEPPEIIEGRVYLVLAESFATAIAWGDKDALIKLRNATGAQLANAGAGGP